MNTFNIIPYFFVAYLLDLVLGDPVWLPHPVKIIGLAAQRLEPVLRRQPSVKEKTAGFVFTLIITGGTFLTGLLVLMVAWRLSVWWGWLLSAVVGYTCISVRDMACHAENIYQSLIKEEMEEARYKTGRIVGRDTKNLSREEICRAAVESIAESTVDGIISPVFYLFMGGPLAGPALALFYKSASTLDSLVGYKNRKYFNFGWASAKLDDILNYLPARIARFIMPLAAVLSGKDGVNSLRFAFQEAGHHPSPNSGIPEAAMAGALGIQLGGSNYYNGRMSVRPFIGQKKRPICPEDIQAALEIMFLSSLVMILSLTMIFVAVRKML